MSTALIPDSEQAPHKKDVTIILAGATGVLGSRIAAYLLQKNIQVRALIRKGSASKEIPVLRAQGAFICEVDFNSIQELTQACLGGFCVVSALSGLREVIVEVQTNLVKAAVAARVPRFIPSDYSIDFTKLPNGTNRNLDLRREFSERLAQEPIAATSVLNGMFIDLLTGEAPVILSGLKRVMYWGDADQPLDFTTIDDTAKFTAAAALDPSTPRYLKIAGEVSSIRELQKTATEVHQKQYRLLRLGGLGVLKTMIRATRFLTPNNEEVYPPWQGMQYLHNMLSGKPKLKPLDNNRYPGIKWTSVGEVLAAHAKE